MKVRYNELEIKLLKNVTHSLEILDLRYSLKRAKTLFLPGSGFRSSSSRKVGRQILDKTGQRVSDETLRYERHR